MQDLAAEHFGMAHLWSQADWVTAAVAVALFAMSLASWYLILIKAWESWRLRQAARAVEGLWIETNVQQGIEQLSAAVREKRSRPQNPFARLAAQASRCESLGRQAARFDVAEQLERALRQQLACAQADLERGLTWLATTGATGPFVGLFGTVWGIYHALLAVAISGQANLERVAGPIGETLVMTAAGLAVALPAVVAYNALSRRNRMLLVELEVFAHDLHALFTAAQAPSAPRRDGECGAVPQVAGELA